MALIVAPNKFITMEAEEIMIMQDTVIIMSETHHLK
jgi:hypothetical protein